MSCQAVVRTVDYSEETTQENRSPYLVSHSTSFHVAIYFASEEPKIYGASL